MAKSNVIITDMSIPNTNGARPITVEDATTNPVKYPGWAFQASTANESIDLFGVCTDEFDSSKDIEIRITWTGASATSGNVKWDSYFLRIVDDSTDLDALDVYTDHDLDTVTDAAPGTATHVTTVTITIAQADHGMTAGDKFHLRLERDQADGADTMSGDAYMLWARLREAA
jgi:hypothetical protein